MRVDFWDIFGVKKEEIQPDCVLVPFLRKEFLRELDIDNLKKGTVYSAGSCPGLTLIHCRPSPAFIGDAVLYLGDSPCRRLFFLGAAGLIDNTVEAAVGNVVTPEISFSSGEFIEMARDFTAFRGPFTPDYGLIDQLTERFNLKTVFCMSVGSLKLEVRFRAKFKADGADVLDLECAAFLAAAEKIDRPAAAILTITDIVGEMPYCRVYQPEEKKRIAAGFSRSAGIVKELSGIEE